MIKHLLIFFSIIFTRCIGFLELPNPVNLVKLNPTNIDFIVDKEILNHNFIDKINVDIVDNLAKIIPNIDSNIGHNVVLLDKEIVINLLNDDFVPPQIKKDIILFIIKITQEGDNIGSFILSNYYNLVQHIL